MVHCEQEMKVLELSSLFDLMVLVFSMLYLAKTDCDVADHVQIELMASWCESLDCRCVCMCV